MKFNSEFLNHIKAESYVNPKVEKRKVDGRGYGLFAKELIPRGDIVSISGGAIIHEKDWDYIRETYGDYAYFIEEGFLICPLNPEDPSDDWRMNHCCEPNCGIKGQIVFVAIKDIQIDEELTFDYAMTESDPDYKVELHCNKETCRKKVTGNDWKLKELQKKYRGNFSLYLQKKIDENLE